MERLHNIAVWPASQFGTIVGAQAAENGNNVSLVFRPESAGDCSYLNRTHVNRRRLPGKKLPDNIRGTTNLGSAISHADIVVMGPDSIHFREAIRKARPSVPVLSLTKGLEGDTNMRMSQVAEDEIPNISDRFGVLSGPSLASEIVEGNPTAVVVASKNPDVATLAQQTFATGNFQIDLTSDVEGTELAAAGKNVIVILVGVADGLGWGPGGLTTLGKGGLMEISRLGIAEGAALETFLGLAGIGDLLATCSMKSRNFRAGRSLGREENTPQKLLKGDETIEGLNTVKPLFELAKLKGVDMPVTEAVYRIIYEEWNKEKALFECFQRIVDLAW